jgi:anti-sigma-K factor RskA
MTPFQHERYREMAAPFALGALDAEEHTEFKAHLRTCDECKQLVTELSQPVAALPLFVPQVAPPPGLRDRVMRAIAAADTDESVPANETAPATTSPWSRFTHAQYVLAAGIAVLALVAASLLGWAVGLRNDVAENERLLARSYDALSVMARADQRWNVQATDAAAGAWGVVAYDSGSDVGSVVMWGLDESADVEYNLWVVEDGQRERVGRLYAADGGFWAVVDENMPSDGIGVTAVDASGVTFDVLDTQLSPR